MADELAEAGRARLLWAVRVRWLTIIGFSALAIPAWVLGLIGSMAPCAIAAGLGAVANAINHRCVAASRHVRGATALAVSADLVLITYLIAATGGVHSPFIMLYVVQVLATALLVGLGLGALAALTAASGVTAAQWLGVGGPVRAPMPAGLLSQVVWGLFLLYGLGLLTLLGGYIAARLRRSEAELAARTAGLSAAEQALRDTTRRLRHTEAQLAQAEKLRALGQFVAGLAHELNNPLGFIAANLEHVRAAMGALERMVDAYAAAPLPAAVRVSLEERARRERLSAWRNELPSALDDCAEGARRAAEIVAALRAFARRGAGESWSMVDLAERLDRAVALLRHRLPPAITVVRDYDRLPPVACLAGPLDQVFLNLLANAIDAVGARGSIAIRLRAAAQAYGGDPQVLISISDDGPGIPAAARSRIFEPFFTTKAEGRGTGLGLSVSYGIVERHGGTIAVQSNAGCGTTFTVALPLRRACPDEADTTPPNET
ncbi:MAG: sensor histidine kinase [Candidatus Binatia bacterium]